MQMQATIKQDTLTGLSGFRVVKVYRLPLQDFAEIRGPDKGAHSLLSYSSFPFEVSLSSRVQLLSTLKVVRLGY